MHDASVFNYRNGLTEVTTPAHISSLDSISVSPSMVIPFPYCVDLNMLSRYYWSIPDIAACPPATGEGQVRSSTRSSTEVPPVVSATVEAEIDTAELKSLEDFAANFKARRIKLGYTQTNVGRSKCVHRACACVYVCVRVRACVRVCLLACLLACVCVAPLCLCASVGAYVCLCTCTCGVRARLHA